MKKIMAILLILAAMTACACAEDALTLLPEGSETTDNGWILPSGERLELVLNEDGGPAALITGEAACSDETQEQSREGAEVAVLAQYPGALILSGETNEDGSRTVAVVTETLFGTIVVKGDGVTSRELYVGRFIENGTLTADGARAALKLLRPDAVLRELEKDNDDGLLLYEGEATVDGVEYEFEMNARTGKLLEWERD